MMYVYVHIYVMYVIRSNGCQSDQNVSKEVTIGITQ